MLDVECTFRVARAGDAAAIVELVNCANSGAGGTAGWTHEANYFEGKRTDIREILDLYADPGSAFVLCMEGEELVGCAYLKRIRSAAYMGLLSVRPTLQARGIGSKIIAECERVARREWHCPTMQISVITSHRPEVTAFYERRGYARTGRLKTFERKNARLAPGVTGLVLEWLEKPLAGTPSPSLAQRPKPEPTIAR
jgi:GNAT superfamily N-acetyltransferase